MSAAILESYDAHMQDYSAETMQDWNDETMEDMSLQYDGDSIEVEMGFDQEDGPTKEYEMVDGDSHDYHPMEADLEVIQTFQPIPLDSTASTDMEHSYYDAMDHHPVDPIGNLPVVESGSDSFTHTEVPTEPVALAEGAIPTYDIPKSGTISEEQPQEATYNTAGEDYTPRDSHDAENAALPLEETQEPTQTSVVSEPQLLPEEDSTRAAEYVSEAQPQQRENDQPPDDAAYEPTSTETHSRHDDPHPGIGEQGEEVAADIQYESHGDEAEAAEPEQGDSLVETAPCVFFSVFPSDSIQFYLFDQPSVDLPGPSTATTEMNSSSLVVLLHSMPWLFSTGLDDVFNALRGEEALTSLLDLNEDELVLDAVDLRLSFSESRKGLNEVTLRDLNDLHDANGLTGPLRIQVQAVPNHLSKFLHMKERMNDLSLASGHEVEVSTSAHLNADYAEENQEQEHEQEQEQIHVHEDDQQTENQSEVQPHEAVASADEGYNVEDNSTEVSEGARQAVETSTSPEDEEAEYQHTEETTNIALEDPSEQTSNQTYEGAEVWDGERFDGDQASEEQYAAEPTESLSNDQDGAEQGADTYDDSEQDTATTYEEHDSHEGDWAEEGEEELKSFEEILDDDLAEHDESATIAVGINPSTDESQKESRDTNEAELSSTNPPASPSPNLSKNVTSPDGDDDGFDSFDTTFELDAATMSNTSSSTLKSQLSTKRSFEEVFEGDVDEEDLEFLHESPNSKRVKNE